MFPWCFLALPSKNKPRAGSVAEAYLHGFGSGKTLAQQFPTRLEILNGNSWSREGRKSAKDLNPTMHGFRSWKFSPLGRDFALLSSFQGELRSDSACGPMNQMVLQVLFTSTF